MLKLTSKSVFVVVCDGVVFDDGTCVSAYMNYIVADVSNV